MECASEHAAARQTCSRVRRGWRRALAMGLILASSSASANITCDGKIDYLGLSPDGSISVSEGFGVWYLCSQTNAASTSNGAECSALGSWLWPNPAPYHLNLQY